MAASVRMNKLKETVKVKNKNHLREQLIAYVCVKTKRTKREMFSASQVQGLWELIQSEKTFGI